MSTTVRLHAGLLDWQEKLLDMFVPAREVPGPPRVPLGRRAGRRGSWGVTR